MKKVSVQFNLEVEDHVTHKYLGECVKAAIINQDLGKATSLQINNVSATRAKAGRDA